MLAELKDEREVLTKLVLANRQNEGVVGYQGSGNSGPASAGDRNSLLVNRGGSPHSRPISGDDHSIAESFHGDSGVQTSSRMSGPRRVFGRVVQAVQETSETRGLDNEGLLHLQQAQMKQQDNHIEQFSAILQRQRHIGMAIGQELDNQIQLLDELDRDVDRTALRLSLVNKKITQIN
jgi:regulator of vacuolar morphogenesis